MPCMADIKPALTQYPRPVCCVTAVAFVAAVMGQCKLLRVTLASSTYLVFKGKMGPAPSCADRTNSCA